MMLCYRHIFITYMFVVNVTHCICLEDLSPEELARRRNVVKLYKSERAEVERDWIETYHLSYGSKGSIITQKTEKKPMLQDSSDSNIEPIKTAADSAGSSISHFRSERYDNYFDGPRAFSATKAKSTITNDEYIRRTSIVTAFIPKLATLEKEDSELAYLISKSKTSGKTSILSAKSTVAYKKESAEGKGKLNKLQQLTDKYKDNINQFKILDNNENFLSFESDRVTFSPAEQSDNIPNVQIFETESEVNKDYPKSSYDANQLDFQGKTLVYSNSEIFLTGKSLKNSRILSASSEIFHRKVTSNETMNVFKEAILNSSQQNRETFKAVDSDTCTETGSSNIKVIHSNTLHKRQGDISKNTVSSNGENSDSVLKAEIYSSTDNANFDKVKVQTVKDIGKDHVDLKILQRQKSVKSYLSALEKEQKDWVETYHLSYSPGDHKKLDLFYSKDYYFSNKKLFNSTDNITVVDINSEKIICPQAHYFIRWTKMLIKKFKGYRVDTFSSITLSFSEDLISYLEKQSSSEDFDVVEFDELVSGLISNATVHNPSQDTFFNTNYLPSVSTILYSLSTLLLLYNLSTLPYFYLFPYKVYLIILIIFIIACAGNYIKMYQEKEAEKHAIISAVAPAYCENILNKESGMWAQVKEHVRYYMYDEKCKKYYEAVMVDTSTELTSFAVITDLVSSAFSQFLKPFGKIMNIFVKDAFQGLGWIQSFFLIISLIIILCFCVLILTVFYGYKINLPFFLGSAEPTKFSKNRIEDVILDDENNFLQNSPKKLQNSCEVKNTLSKDCGKCDSMKYIEDTFKIEGKHSKALTDFTVTPTQPDVSLIAYTVQGKNVIYVDKLISNEKILPVELKPPASISTDNFMSVTHNSHKRRYSF